MTPHWTSTNGPDGEPVARPRALVIDDDPLFRSLLVAMLKRDYAVTAAVDGSDGFYKALEGPPDIAVIDVQMPVWDGLRTIRAFRENALLSHVPVVVLSSDATRETVLAAIAAGADDYVIKSSFSRDELLQKMTRLRQRGDAEWPSASALDDGDLQRVSSGGASTADLAPIGAGLADRLQETIDAWE